MEVVSRVIPVFIKRILQLLFKPHGRDVGNNLKQTDSHGSQQATAGGNVNQMTINFAGTPGPETVTPLLGMTIEEHSSVHTGNPEPKLGKPILALNQCVLKVDVTFKPNNDMQVGKVELRSKDGLRLPVFGFAPRDIKKVETHTVQFVVTSGELTKERAVHIWALAAGQEFKSPEFTP